MPGQPLTGKRSSTRKAVTLKAADDKKIIFKEMGNGHSYPMVWADTVTMSGTSCVVASGVSFHGMSLAKEGNVTATPQALVTANYYIAKDEATNVVSIEADANVVAKFDVQFVLGPNNKERYIEDYV